MRTVYLRRLGLIRPVHAARGALHINVPAAQSAVAKHGSFTAFAMTSLRLKSDVPSKPSIDSSDWRTVKQFIPGEKTQTNDIKDWIPKFPLGKENVPTLLPKPGVPRVGKNMAFRQVVNILKNRTQPELIYEAEPHRLYFLGTACCGLVFLIYGVVLAEWAVFQANKDYNENEEEKNEVIKKREWVLDLMKNSVFSIILFVAAYGMITFPNRIVRTIHYLPGPAEHVRLTTYPLLPGRPTPVITVPLKNIVRKHKARVWTGKGFYGTADNSLFFFVLQENNDSGKLVKSWVVDRKGFFWSDGRVFDYIFGKESIQEAEAGIPYDEQIGIVNRQVQQKKKQLKQKYGFFYKWKLGAQDLQQDVKQLGTKASGLVKKHPKK